MSDGSTTDKYTTDGEESTVEDSLPIPVAQTLSSPEDVSDFPEDPSEFPEPPPTNVNEAPSDLGEAPSDSPEAPSDLGKAPSDSPEAPSDWPEAPLDLGEAPSVSPEAPLTFSAMDFRPCPLYNKLLERCQQPCKPPTYVPPRLDTVTAKIARDLVQDVVRRVTKPKPVRRMKKPVMKSGWMDWSEIIPKFDIDDQLFKKILFAEKLLISTFENGSAYPSPVGALCLDVQLGRGGALMHQNHKNKTDYLLPKFLVHLSSQLDFMGSNGGSRITAWVDRDLQTLEEKRREYLQLDDVFDQQVLYINSQENFYYLRHDKKEDIFYSKDRAMNLICEGSNFVLMRYLALTRFVGTFETSTLYIDGSLCRNIYYCKGPSSGLVNNKKLDVCKIYRTIIEQCGIQHKSITLLTLHGQILKQEWRNSNYTLQINPLCEVRDDKPCGIERIPLECKSDDLQMLSLYLDAKVYNKKMADNYMEDHPEITDMLGDYLQSILQLKPEDIFKFTAKYFLAFTPALLPLSEYYEPQYNEDDEDEDFEFWKYI